MNASAVRTRRRSGWDVVLGVGLVLAGFLVLGHTVAATAISVLLLGWVALLSGIAAVVAALFAIGRDGFWPTALTGGLFVVLGVVFLANPAAAALTLALVAGALFLVSGLTRITASFRYRTYRWPLLLGGVVSAALGLIVLFNLVALSFTLLGVLVGVQALVDGITLLLSGRVRTTEMPRADGAAVPDPSVNR